MDPHVINYLFTKCGWPGRRQNNRTIVHNGIPEFPDFYLRTWPKCMIPAKFVINWFNLPEWSKRFYQLTPFRHNLDSLCYIYISMKNSTCLNEREKNIELLYKGKLMWREIESKLKIRTSKVEFHLPQNIQLEKCWDNDIINFLLANCFTLWIIVTHRNIAIFPFPSKFFCP